MTSVRGKVSKRLPRTVDSVIIEGKVKFGLVECRARGGRSRIVKTKAERSIEALTWAAVIIWLGLPWSPISWATPG